MGIEVDHPVAQVLQNVFLGLVHPLKVLVPECGMRLTLPGKPGDCVPSLLDGFCHFFLSVFRVAEEPLGLSSIVLGNESFFLARPADDRIDVELGIAEQNAVGEVSPHFGITSRQI